MIEAWLARLAHDLFAAGPLRFRFIIQPAVAAFFAIRYGIRDAKAGRPLYFWTIVGDPASRKALIREGWSHIGKLLVAAFIVDCIFQVMVERWIYPLQALIVSVILAVLPYFVFRGLANRLFRARYERKTT